MFDVGAHAGYTALVAAQIVGDAGHVVVEIHDRAAHDRFGLALSEHRYRCWVEGQPHELLSIGAWDERRLYLACPE